MAQRPTSFDLTDVNMSSMDPAG